MWHLRRRKKGKEKCKGRKRWLSPDRWVLQVGVSEFLSSEMRFCKGSKRPCHRNLVRACGTRAVEGGRGLKIEKVGMEGGRTERSRRQLLRERESLFFCLEDQTSFCNRKFSTAAPAKPDPAETINVSWIKWNTGGVLRGDATTSRNANIKKEPLFFIRVYTHTW